MSMQKQDSVVLEARSSQRHEPDERAACGSAWCLVPETRAIQRSVCKSKATRTNRQCRGRQRVTEGAVMGEGKEKARQLIPTARG